jgi:hypothetical protein
MLASNFFFFAHDGKVTQYHSPETMGNEMRKVTNKKNNFFLISWPTKKIKINKIVHTLHLDYSRSRYYFYFISFEEYKCTHI